MAAYKAYLNNEIFFATDVKLDKVRLLSTSIDLEAGASGEFDFTIPPCNLAYGNFHKKVDDITVYEGENLIFSGRPYYIKQDFGLNHLIKCEGYLTILNDTVIRPFTYSGTLTGLLEEFRDQHNSQVGPEKQFEIGNITITDRNDYLYREYTAYEKTNNRLKDLVSVYGGYPIIRKTNGTLFLDWIETFTEESNQEIVIKENILDVTQTEDSAGIMTVLIPLGAEIEDEQTGIKRRLTIESVNGGRDYIESATGISQFGRIVDFHIWDDVTTAAQLYRKGLAWLQDNSQQKLQVSISAVDLADAGYDVDNFKIGQKMKVTAEQHGINSRWFTCLHLKLDPLHPGQKSLVMESVIAGYIKTTRDAQDQYNRLIEKVVANYVTNTALSNVATTLNQRIEYNTTLIEQNAQAISLKADASVVDGLGTRLAAAEAEITIQAGQIALKADSSTVNAIGTRVTQAELDIDAAEAAIALKADQTTVNALSARVTSAEADIDAAEAAIALKASQTDLNALGTRVTAAEADIDANAAAITLKASQSDMTALTGRVTAAEADIDANAAAIALKADQTVVTALTTRVSTAEADISANAAAIALKASQTDLNALGTRVTQAELDIDAAEGQISSKVSTSDFTGANIASLINQSASSVTINAAHINLTAQNIADKINSADSSVVISAAHIELTGEISISDLTAAAKASIVSDVESVTEYYLSTSDSVCTGGSWSTTIPAWVSGKYVWIRTKTTKVDAAGTISTSETSETYDQNLTKALTDAASAVTTANSANTAATTANKRATYHFATCSTVAGTAAKVGSCSGFELFTGATVTVYFTNANTAADPTLNVNDTGAKSIRVKDANIAAAYYWQAKDTVTFVYNGTYWVMAESSANAVIANWCHSNDKTYIDGGKLYTGSITTDKLAAQAVTAAKIDTADLFAQTLTASNFNITGGSVNINTSSDTTDVISLSHNDNNMKVNPGGFQVYVSNKKRWQLLSGTLMGYDASGNVTIGLSTAAGAIDTTGKSTFGAINADLFRRKAVTLLNQQSLAGDGYAGNTVTITPDAGYTVIGIIGWSITTTDGAQYARYMNVWRLYMTSDTSIYFAICNGGTNTRTVTLNVYLLELKTTA
jgi:hypothetical protein